MRKIFLFLALIMSFSASFSQSPGNYTPVSGKWEYVYLKIDKGVKIPQDTLPTADTGSIAIIGSTLYIHTFPYWTAITGAGGSGIWGFISGSITSQTDLQAALHAKLDTSKRKVDTLYAITDSSFGMYINGQFRTFKARGAIPSFNGRTGAITLAAIDVTNALGYSPLPIGGNTGQALMKNSSTNYDVSWQTVGGGKDIDVFLVAGQSNAQGHGDSTLSPAPINGKVWQMNQGILTPAKDPIGVNIGSTASQAVYGSAWPSFGNTYYNRTSRMICMVPSSVGGTSQTAAGDVGNGNWDTTGVLFDSAVARVNKSMAALIAQGYNPTFKGVIWLQGESDAIAYEAGSITVTDYTNAFKKMLRRFRTNFGAAMPFYVIQIGTSTTHADSWFQGIRDAQQTVANSDSMTTIVYYNARNFITRSLLVDNIHFNQVGLNEVGQLSALAVTSNMKNIIQTQTSTVWYPQTMGVGAAPTNGFDFEIAGRNPSGNSGIAITNNSTGSSATSMVRFYNSGGVNAHIWATGTSAGSNIGGPGTLVLYAQQSGGIRLVNFGGGDIVFSKTTQTAGGSMGRFTYANGNFLFNTETDNNSNGKFQINSSSWFNGLMKMYGVTAPPSTYNLLVHGSDSGSYQLPFNQVRGYNVYTALLNQSGTSAPTASILGNNEIGSITWARTSTGTYTGTLTGAFTSSKTFLSFAPIDDGSGTIKIVRTDANTITITTRSSGTLTDALLIDYPLEIRVYP